MVDARLTPLAAMGLDRGTLMRDGGLRLHGGVVYPGIRALSAEKGPREGTAHPLGYGRGGAEGLPELIYKPESPLDSRSKAATNGYLGLYSKGTPPGLHKPVLMPGGGEAAALGLDRRPGVGGPGGEKPSELAAAGLAGAGAGSYLRLPWLSPYPEASMYPFMDSSKYAALSMYKASLLGQPSPYLPQHLAYQSLCAAPPQGPAATSAAAAERLFYMSPYPPSPISSPLVPPPMRIPAVSVAASTSLGVHCQDKGLNVGAFGQQLHQADRERERERSPGRIGGKPSRPPSGKGPTGNSNSNGGNTGGNNNNSGLPIDSSPHASSRHPQAQPPPALIDGSMDVQRPVPRIPTSSAPSSSSSSSQSMPPHPFSVSSMAPEQQQQPSPARPSPHKPRPSDHHNRGGETRRPSRSPSKTGFDRPPGATTKEQPTEKPLDLSGRMLEFGLHPPPPNGYPVKMDALAPPGARYGMAPSSRELLKETLSMSPPLHPHSMVGSTSSSSSSSSKASERPEMISTLRSSWVVPNQPPHPSHTQQHTPGRPLSPRSSGAADSPQAKGSSPSVIKHKGGLERVPPQQRSSSCPRMGEPPVPTSASSLVTPARPISPKPNGDWAKHSPGQSEHHRDSAEKPSQASKRGEATPDVSSSAYKRPCLENGHPPPPGHLYLPQSDAYLNHSLAYANRYLHYSIPDGMALHSHPLAGKGPVYPHPVLLDSLYPSHLAAKHPAMPYHNLPAAGPGGEYLTYNSQEMAHPLMQPHAAAATDPKAHERVDASLKQPRGSEKPPRGEECGGGGGHRDRGSDGKAEREAASSLSSRDKIVCIDLVHSDTDVESSTPAVAKQPLLPVPSGGAAKVNQNECCHGNQSQLKSNGEPRHHPQHPSPHAVRRDHSPSSMKHNHHADRPSDTPFGRPRVSQDTGYPGAASSPPPASSSSSPGLALRAEESAEEEEEHASSDPEDQDPSTLRCARTSGFFYGKRRGPQPPPLPPALYCTGANGGRDAERERAAGGATLSERGGDAAEREDSIVDPEESHGEVDEDDGEEGGCHGSSKGSRRSSLAKRIANSSGYVGDRFKCVTTELYADTSKLTREQRALQRAMMRFSELELKEKEGGGGGGGGVCASALAVAAAAAATGRDLAGGQRRERELEHCQHTATRQGEREGE